MTEPLWLRIVAAVGQAISMLWFYTGVIRFGRVKGTKTEVLCRNIMCELRPLVWPAYVVRSFGAEVNWWLSPKPHWWDSPGFWHFLSLLDFLAYLFYWWWFRKDKDDDRWQRRRKRLSKRIKAQLTIPTPVHSKN